MVTPIRVGKYTPSEEPCYSASAPSPCRSRSSVDSNHTCNRYAPPVHSARSPSPCAGIMNRPSPVHPDVALPLRHLFLGRGAAKSRPLGQISLSTVQADSIRQLQHVLPQTARTPG